MFHLQRAWLSNWPEECQYQQHPRTSSIWANEWKRVYRSAVEECTCGFVAVHGTASMAYVRGLPLVNVLPLWSDITDIHRIRPELWDIETVNGTVRHGWSFMRWCTSTYRWDHSREIRAIWERQLSKWKVSITESKWKIMYSIAMHWKAVCAELVETISAWGRRQDKTSQSNWLTCDEQRAI